MLKKCFVKVHLIKQNDFLVLETVNKLCLLNLGQVQQILVSVNITKPRQNVSIAQIVCIVIMQKVLLEHTTDCKILSIITSIQYYRN